MILRSQEKLISYRLEVRGQLTLLFSRFQYPNLAANEGEFDVVEAQHGPCYVGSKATYDRGVRVKEKRIWGETADTSILSQILTAAVSQCWFRVPP